MLYFPAPLFAKAEGGPPPAIGPIDPATLFGASEKGGYYNFTDAASLAINADGTGGVPAVDGACRSVLDKSPNGNRLRNTVSSVTRRANGIETSGTGYGLFNFATVGDWPNIPQPFEIVARIEQIAFAAADRRILQANVGTFFILQGAAAGDVRAYAGAYGPAVAPGIAAEFTLDFFASGASSTQALDGGAMSAAFNSGGAPLDGLVLGSDAGGNNATQTRFEHLLVIDRALTTAERAGVAAWMAA